MDFVSDEFNRSRFEKFMVISGKYTELRRNVIVSKIEIFILIVFCFRE